VRSDGNYTDAMPSRINPNPNFKRIDIFAYLDGIKHSDYKPYAKLEDTAKQEPHVEKSEKSEKRNNAATKDVDDNVDMLQGDEVEEDDDPSRTWSKTKAKVTKTQAAKLSARAPTEAEDIAPLEYSANSAANTRQTRSRMNEPSTPPVNSDRQLRSRSLSKTPATPGKSGRDDHPLDEGRLFHSHFFYSDAIVLAPKRSKPKPKSILKRPKIDDSDAEDTDELVRSKRQRFEHGAKPGDGSLHDKAANKGKDKANSKERGKGKSSKSLVCCI
jgi:hypothetical protein